MTKLAVKYIRPLFDIQRVYIDGKSFHYEIYYRSGRSFERVTDREFDSMRDAENFIDELLTSEV